MDDIKVRTYRLGPAVFWIVSVQAHIRLPGNEELIKDKSREATRPVIMRMDDTTCRKVERRRGPELM